MGAAEIRLHGARAERCGPDDLGITRRQVFGRPGACRATRPVVLKPSAEPPDRHRNLEYEADKEADRQTSGNFSDREGGTTALPRFQAVARSHAWTSDSLPH